MKNLLTARLQIVLGPSLALILLAGCSWGNRGTTATTPRAGEKEVGPTAAQTDPQVALARRIYDALSRGDTRPIEARLAEDAYDVMVAADTDEEGGYYYGGPGGDRPDWGPLLRWVGNRPPSTLRQAHAGVSPHDPYNVLVTLEMENGYFYLLIRDGQAISKVVASTQPVDWD